jgi:four helix bundle protein
MRQWIDDQNPAMQDFRRLDVWRVAHELTLETYRATAGMPSAERYGLTAQMRSAVVSIESNIAEGCGRGSKRDLARFLHFAAGPANELDCQIQIALDLGYFTPDSADALSNKRRRVKQMLTSLLSRVRSTG